MTQWSNSNKILLEAIGSFLVSEMKQQILDKASRLSADLHRRTWDMRVVVLARENKKYEE